ncbi:hypothetical protein VTO73DRAFT_10377 [Trametes versicolor]
MNINLMITPPHPYSVGRSTGSHRGPQRISAFMAGHRSEMPAPYRSSKLTSRARPSNVDTRAVTGCYTRKCADRAIARHTPPVRPHATWGLDSHSMSRRATRPLIAQTPQFLAQDLASSGLGQEHPPCHACTDLQIRRSVPPRRFRTPRYLPVFCAGVFVDAYPLTGAFI